MNSVGRKAISLVEVLIAMAILSTLALPMGMFLVEYARGSSQLGDYYQILNMVEQRLEIAMDMPFARVPEGTTTNMLIDNPFGAELDLRPAEINKELVKFSLQVETLPVEFAAFKDSFSGQLQRARVEDGMKRLELTASWGNKGQHRINLIAYRGNL
ncbi:MAG: type IV pilus modification PilV family protein [Candidatus Rifleibacteriota bacterium]